MSAAAGLLWLGIRIPPGVWMFVSCECCVLPGRGVCDRTISRPTESYRVGCVCVISKPQQWGGLGASMAVAPREKRPKYVKTRFYCGFKINHWGKNYINGLNVLTEILQTKQITGQERKNVRMFRIAKRMMGLVLRYQKSAAEKTFYGKYQCIFMYFAHWHILCQMTLYQMHNSCNIC
jgi:hypothetical protein